jgi:hypothetical protein
MWRQDPVGTALPVAGGGREKALPHARWRAGIRGPKGGAKRQLQARPLYSRDVGVSSVAEEEYSRSEGANQVASKDYW